MPNTLNRAELIDLVRDMELVTRASTNCATAEAAETFLAISIEGWIDQLKLRLGIISGV